MATFLAKKSMLDRRGLQCTAVFGSNVFRNWARYRQLLLFTLGTTVFICNSAVGEKKVLLTYNNIINNINCVHKVFLNLKCVLNVLTQNIFQDWMNLSTVLQLLSSCWEWNVRAWALLKSWEEKSATSSEEVRMIVQTIQGINVKINIPEIFWNVFWQIMNSRL